MFENVLWGEKGSMMMIDENSMSLLRSFLNNL